MSDFHRLLQVLVDLVEETGGGQPLLVGADQDRKVLGHVAGLDGPDRDFLERIREFRQLRIVVELGAMREPAAPGVDRGHRIGRGLLALLVLAVMAGDGAVRGFYVMGYDVTERRKAEEALARERTLLHQIIDNLPDHVYVKDRERRYLLINAAGQKARKITDQAARTKIYGEMQAIFKAEAPWMTVAHSTVFEPIRKEVSGYKVSPLGAHEFQNVDVAE